MWARIRQLWSKGPSRQRLAVEFIALYLGIPLLIFFGTVPRLALVILMIIFIVALWRLLKDPDFPNRQLFDFSAFPTHFSNIIGRFIFVAILLSGAVLLFQPEDFLNLARERPLLWMLVMIFYPLVSVYPQEFLFRVLFFYRYRPLFSSTRMAILANMGTFAFAHIFFYNPVALLLTFFGGYLFATTYLRTGSLLLVAAEHALYGCFVFTVGLGE